ncbi:MAG: class B sortase [Defluviitaleaceae bacterium]|nr:class B sortase [Defluviitaleaceae bacterium]
MNNPKKFKPRKKTPASRQKSSEKMPWVTVGVLAILCAASLTTGIVYWYTTYFRPVEIVTQAHLEVAAGDINLAEGPDSERDTQSEETGPGADYNASGMYNADGTQTEPPVQNEEISQPRPAAEPLPKFVTLREEYGNDDIVGILTLAGQEILIVQGDDNEFYLTHNLSGEYSDGWIFLDYEADLLLGYDHNMVIHVPAGCEMFSVLRSYIEYDFFLEFPTISFSTLYGPFDWEIFSFYVAPAAFPFAVANHPNDYIWGDMLEQFTLLSFYNTMLDVTMYDQILTITAPTAPGSDLFYVLQARMLRLITS